MMKLTEEKIIQMTLKVETIQSRIVCEGVSNGYSSPFCSRDLRLSVAETCGPYSQNTKDRCDVGLNSSSNDYFERQSKSLMKYWHEI